MQDYPFVFLPDYYVQLLRENMRGVENNPKFFENFLYDHKFLSTLLEHFFDDVSSPFEIEKVLKALNFKGVRNRLAHLYLHHFLKKEFALGERAKHLLEEIIHFEEHFSPYEKEGTSRFFLLGFYLKMSSMKPNEELFEFFKYSKIKTFRPDWLYILLDHFLSFLGEEKLKDILKKETSFKEILSFLSPEQRKKFLTNLLSYSASIHEPEIFLTEKFVL